MVMPPELTATVESALTWAPAEPSAVAGDSVVGAGAKGSPSLSHDAHGEKVAKISPPITLKSSADSASGTCNRPGMKVEFMVPSSRLADGRKLLATGLRRSPPVF